MKRPWDATVIWRTHLWLVVCYAVPEVPAPRRVDAMKLLEPQGLIIILVIVLIIFGPKRLPELGKSLGNTIKGFREATEGKVDAEESDATTKDQAAS